MPWFCRMNWFAKRASCACRSRAAPNESRKVAGWRKAVESPVSRQAVGRGAGFEETNPERILPGRFPAISLQGFKPLEIGSNGIRECRHVSLTQILLKER